MSEERYSRQCQQLADKYFPELSEEQQINLFWSATAFPFAKPNLLEKQLKEKAKKVEDIEDPEDRLNACCAIADQEMQKAMKEHKSKSKGN